MGQFMGDDAVQLTRGKMPQRTDRNRDDRFLLRTGGERHHVLAGQAIQLRHVFEAGALAQRVDRVVGLRPIVGLDRLGVEHLHDQRRRHAPGRHDPRGDQSSSDDYTVGTGDQIGAEQQHCSDRAQ
jgi:hypothetical protein